MCAILSVSVNDRDCARERECVCVCVSQSSIATDCVYTSVLVSICVDRRDEQRNKIWY